MKQLFLFGVLGLMMAAANANQTQENPLPIQYAEPAPMGEPVQAQPVKLEQTKYNTQLHQRGAIYLGYAGSNIDSIYLDEDKNHHGVDIGYAAEYIDNVNYGVGYTYQASSDWEYSEVYAKLGYRFFERNANYGATSLGVGYVWGDAKDYDLDTEYFSVPIELEFGHYVQPNFAIYGTLGYKWLFNQDVDLCASGECASADGLDELDLDGLTYKLGMKYHF